MIEALLRKLELRDPLPADERSALAESFGAQKRYHTRDTLVAQDSRPHESTLLLTGLAARVTALKDGTQQITLLHVAGDFIDLQSFLAPTMDHSVVALSECTATRIAHTKLRTITAQWPHLARLLWLNTVIDAAIHRQWLVAMGRMDALGQMAHLLCEHSLRLKSVGLSPEHDFDFPITQVDFADVLGMSSVHLNRTLQKLRGLKLVAWSGDRVRILDWEALVELAEFDATYLQLGPMAV